MTIDEIKAAMARQAELHTAAVQIVEILEPFTEDECEIILGLVTEDAE